MAGPLHDSPQGPLYVYGIVRRGFRPRPGLTGVGGAAVVVVPEGSLAALASAADSTSGPPSVSGPPGVSDPPGVSGPPGEPAADDASLQATADAHRRVVDEAAAAVCVLPTRLGTVHRDAQEVRRILAARADLYRRLLARLDGRLEWGVKAYAEGEEAGAAPTGTESVADGAGEPTDGLARAAHHTLADVAECSCVHPPRDACPAGAAASRATSAYWTSPIARAPYPHGRNLLDSAYLVPREAAGAFAETVGGLAARSPALRIELTGPWAPYSFAEPGRLPGFPGFPGFPG
ncbi:GvpL/GvpF family gas vesicle protein [Streptomyces sp. NPDC000151]|uniref:GvpL/GvpF family gas vesicle protein n=1 Tax=Streptomyces sp. NPDC000151 TaxID=3154244 RepID=UPI0033261978